MSVSTRKNTWLPQFRRSLAYLHPHRRPLIAGLLLALGVSVCYTFSISAVVPLLKIMFAEHEPLSVWVHRMEAQRRLGIATPADVPDTADGLMVVSVRDGSPCAGLLAAGDRIEQLESTGEQVGSAAASSYAVLSEIARQPGNQISQARIRDAEGAVRTVVLTLRPYRRWWGLLEWGVGFLPAGMDRSSRLTTLTVVMSVFVLLSVLGGVCRFLNEALVATAVQRSMHDLRTRLGGHVLRLPMDWYSRHPPGDALSRFATDINKVEVGLTTMFGKVVREPLKAAGVLALTVAIDWHLLLVAAVGLPIGALVIRTFGRRVKTSQRRASQSWGRLLDHLGERLAGVRVVKAFNMEETENRHFELEGRRLTRAQTHVELIDAATKPVLETLAMVAVAAFVLYGGMLVFSAQIEANLFFAAVICLGGMFDPLRKMGNVNNRLQAAEASASRLFELMDLRTECASGRTPDAGTPRAAGEDGALLAPFKECICFEKVGFAYPTSPNAPVLRDVDLTLRKGQMVALVGPNGAGKTTLVSLLLRFFEPQKGRILIDGVDIAGVTLASLRGQIGLVTQDTVIFSDTARFNIAYGANGVSDADVLRAARMAHADEFIGELRVEHDGEVTSGYEAQINTRSLSGGQRQRIAIARAVLRDPPILILDEATSQVDADSERKIQEAMEEITQGRTTFVIAHRFSTIARADLIVVLDQGRVAGIGGHDELMQSCPLYETLYATQFERSP